MTLRVTDLNLIQIEEFSPNLDEYAERVLLGPQAEIVEKIERFNIRYQTNLKCTKTFRWSPGAFDQIKKAYMRHILDWGKRYSGVYQFFNRIDNKQWHHRGMRESINTINNEMTDMRTQGLTFQNNSQIVKDTFDNILNKIEEQHSLVKELYSEQDLRYEIYVDDNDLDTNYVIDIMISNSTMSISNSGEKLVDIKSYPLLLRVVMPVFQNINSAVGRGRKYGRLSSWAQYLAPSDSLKFPFLSQYRRYNEETPIDWKAVCFGDMTGQIYQSIWDFDLLASSTLLMQWISRYDTSFTHPHNKPNLMYYGLPKYIKDQEKSTQYLQAIPHDTEHCGVPSAIRNLSIDKREYAIINDTTCNDIECQLKDNCVYYNNILNASNSRIDNIVKIAESDDLSQQLNSEINIWDELWAFRNSTDSHITETVLDIINSEVETNEIVDQVEDNDYMQDCNEELTQEERTMRWIERQVAANNRQ